MPRPPSSTPTPYNAYSKGAAIGFIRLASQTSKKTFACSTERMSQFDTRARGMIDQILMTTEEERALGVLLHHTRVSHRSSARRRS